MKNSLLSLALLVVFTITANAQFNVGGGGNYTNYGGDVNKATPGAQLRVGYMLSEKKGVSLGFNYGLPMKENYSEAGVDVKTQASFMTLSLAGIYHLIGAADDNFSLYIPVGGSYVLGKSKATSGEVNMEEKFNGLTLNGGVGAQFKIGVPLIFLEAGFALPTGSSSTNSREGTTENPNPISSHSIVNIGLKFPFGSSGSGNNFW